MQLLTVEFAHLGGRGLITQKEATGDKKYTVKGGLELYLAERRDPLGYDSNGRRLYHSQDNIFIAVAAAFMQSSIAVLDASTATPSFVVVRTARIGVRSPHGPLLGAQTTGLQADSGRRARAQAIDGARGQIALSVSTPRAGASCLHYEGVVLRPYGRRMLERLPASLDAVCMVMCDARAPEALCSAAGVAPPSPPTAWPPTCLCDADAAPEALMPAAGTEGPASDAAFAPGPVLGGGGEGMARGGRRVSTVCHLAVEGGVGVGKSTCIAALAARFAADPAASCCRSRSRTGARAGCCGACTTAR